MLTLFELFGAVFLFIWCKNGVPTPLFQYCCDRKSRAACVWGAVRKNIISDRFSTKTAISAHIQLSLRIDSYLSAHLVISCRDSYLCAHLAISVQRQLSLHAFSYLCAHLAISARIQLSLRAFSYLCAQLAISAQRQLSLHAFNYICAYLTISACIQLFLRAFSYLCTHLAISAHVQLNLHTYIVLKRVGGKHGIMSEEKLGVLFQ